MTAGGDSPLPTGSAEAAEYQFALDHWDEITSDLTPHPDDASLDPPLPPYGTQAPPPPDPGIRRFFRVKQTAIDTNSNGFPDWWELQNGYSAFATSGSTFADPTADPDHDGLTNLEEYELHTDPHNRDTDGDYSPDGEEHDSGTDPLSARSTPLVLLPMNRALYSFFTWHDSYSNGLYHHDRHLYDENPQATLPWLLKPLPALDQNDIAGLPDFPNLHTDFAALVPFPPAPPAWFLHQARPGIGHGSSICECDLKDEGGIYLLHQRLWLRGAAPLDADLLVPVEILTYAMPGDPAQPAPFATETKWLRIPAGQNISENYADALSGFAPYYPWAGYTPGTAHAYWDHPDPTGWRQIVEHVTTLGDPDHQFDLMSDLNNDGQITAADNALRDAAEQPGASPEAVEKAMEYMFLNDNLSNGAWDKDDTDTPDKPATATSDDDAEELKTLIHEDSDAVWFEHPAIEMLSFYKTKACLPADKLEFPFHLSPTVQFPDKIYMRADGEWPVALPGAQIDGELAFKFGSTDKTTVIAVRKITLKLERWLGGVL